VRSYNMIEFTKGNMFARPVDARVNTVNCVGVMGAGVALAFKKRYPDMFREYQLECMANRVVPGRLHVWKGRDGEWVINLPTKRDWQDPSRYEDIASGLEALRSYLSGQGAISVALPALGCGHGGLDWSRVSAMIKEALSGLDAHIFVYEPADSRNAGRLAQEQPTPEEIRELERLGFSYASFSQRLDKAELPSAISAKGDPSLLARQWIALLPSKEPSEREFEALNAIARQMTSSKQSAPIALVHATRATEHVAKIFLEHHIAVILILPFGPLTRKSVANIPPSEQDTPFLIASIAGPNETWSRAALGRSMEMLRQGASSVLLSDPTPVWLNEKAIKSWAERPVFYLHYGHQPDSVRRVLSKVDAHPITRRANTGEPNLSMLFAALAHDIGHAEVNANDLDHIDLPLTSSAASQLRSIADAIERNTNWAETILSITFRYPPESEHLRTTLRHIVSDDGGASNKVSKSHSHRALHEKKHRGSKKKHSQAGPNDQDSNAPVQRYARDKKRRQSKKKRSQPELFD
jgi:O-acetyl-ADP-ribose deacetylase (regulator of RNase III)